MTKSIMHEISFMPYTKPRVLASFAKKKKDSINADGDDESVALKTT
jgi:hypothetical protein